MTLAVKDPTHALDIDMTMKHLLVNRNNTKVGKVAGLLSVLDLTIEVVGDLGRVAVVPLVSPVIVAVPLSRGTRDILLCLIIEVGSLRHTKLEEVVGLGQVGNHPRVDTGPVNFVDRGRGTCRPWPVWDAEDGRHVLPD